VALRLPNLAPSKKENVKMRIDVALRNAKTLLAYGKVNFQDAVSNLRVPNKDALSQAFEGALLRMKADFAEIPSLSAWASIHLAGKAVISLLATGGLVVITD
jgi:hypothetical protein